MQLWFLFALLSAIFWGIEQFFHKVAAFRKLNLSSVTLVYSATTLILSIVFFILFQKEFTNLQLLLLVGATNAVGVFIGFVTRLNALRYLSGSIFFPLNKTGILLGMVVISLLFLRESLTILQFIGISLAVFSIFLLTYEKKGPDKKNKLNTTGLILTGISTVAFIGANFISSYASTKVEPFEFLLVAYSGIFALSLGYRIGIVKEKIHLHSIKKGEYKIGALIGLCNIVGFALFFMAFETGLFSLVGALNNFSLPVTIGLLFIVLKERPARIQLAGMTLAFLSLFLLR